jgi:23S rRNA pseudouridine2605 synthase
LARALSKLGILSRSQAVAAIRNGRVTVDGRVVTDPAALVTPERARLTLDGTPQARAAWRAIAFHKPRHTLTTRTDPEGRRTIYDVLGDAARNLVAVGRLDWATSGLLLLTTDTRLADWVTDPKHSVARVYLATVRGRVDRAAAERLTSGVGVGGERLGASSVHVRKASGRESHVVIELREGKNREVRRLFEAIGHEVTRLKRVQFGGLELGHLREGEWRELSADEIRSAFPGAPISRKP